MLAFAASGVQAPQNKGLEWMHISRPQNTPRPSLPPLFPLSSPPGSPWCLQVKAFLSLLPCPPILLWGTQCGRVAVLARMAVGVNLNLPSLVRQWLNCLPQRSWGISFPFCCSSAGSKPVPGRLTGQCFLDLFSEEAGLRPVTELVLLRSPLPHPLAVIS